VIAVPVDTDKLSEFLLGKRTFDAEGIEIPFPQQTVWMRSDPAVAG
jgi:small-conductance mechanosensitive channel